MFYDRPIGSFSFNVPGGETATPEEIREASWNEIRLAENFNSNVNALERAYDARNDQIKKTLGEDLPNPARDPGAFGVPPDRHIGRLRFNYEAGRPVGLTPLPERDNAHRAYQRRLEELAEQHPDFADIIAADRPVLQDARRLTAAAPGHAEEVWARSDRGMYAWANSLTATFGAAMSDPVNMLALALGPFGEAGAGIKGLLWMGIKAGAANAAGEAFTQPFVQKWRADSGLPHGLDIAATNVAAAALFGFGLDAGVRSAVRGVRRAIGRPYLGPSPEPQGSPRTGEGVGQSTAAGQLR